MKPTDEFREFLTMIPHEKDPGTSNTRELQLLNIYVQLLYHSMIQTKKKLKNIPPRGGNHLLLELAYEGVNWHTNWLHSQKDLTTCQGLSSSPLLKASCHHKSFVV